jgi:hypothetical protein
MSGGPLSNFLAGGPPGPFKAETRQTNNAEEYGRLTQSADFLDRHERASAAADLLSGVADNAQRAREARDAGNRCR